MSKVQLIIAMDAETKQQIEAAAAKQQLSIDDYVTAAVLRRLAYDGLEATTPRMTIEASLQHLERISANREKILAERNGELIDVNAIIDLVREERDAELYPIEDGQVDLEQSDSVRRSIFDDEL